MSTARREFIKQVGIVLGSLMLARCTLFQVPDDSPRGRLRNCWGRLDWLVQQIEKDFERGSKARDQLVADHRAALDDLVAANELDASVAERVQSAFDEAVYHIWHSNAVTCYETQGPIYQAASRGQLVQQANLLAEMAQSGSLASETVALAQAALERDIAFLSLSPTETEALYDKLVTPGGRYPLFDDVDLEIMPQAAEAARFLVELLSGQ
jgi:hypothetical protein